MLLPVMLSNGADLTVKNEVREPSQLGQLAARYGSSSRYKARREEKGERLGREQKKNKSGECHIETSLNRYFIEITVTLVLKRPSFG
jgi:hypothetical protein